MFALDRVFDSTISTNNPEPASQQAVFEALGYDALCLAWAGINTSIFAYGQTGSGERRAFIQQISNDFVTLNFMVTPILTLTLALTLIYY